MTATLPAPHDAISIESIGWSKDRDFCTVEYIGPSLEALNAAGCIDRDVLLAFTTTKQRNYYHFEGTCARRRWYSSPPQWKVTWRVKREFALTLPGVSALSAWDARDDETQDDGMVERTRCVGRLQRPIRWTVVDRTLIVPDWPAVRAAAAARRAQVQS